MIIEYYHIQKLKLKARVLHKVRYTIYASYVHIHRCMLHVFLKYSSTNSVPVNKHFFFKLSLYSYQP